MSNVLMISPPVAGRMITGTPSGQSYWDGPQPGQQVSVNEADVSMLLGLGYILAPVVEGGSGTEGPQGPPGPQGSPGPAGSQGPPGPTAVSNNSPNMARLGTDELLLVTPPIPGVTDGSYAAVGNVGEILSISNTVGVTLTTDVTANIATLNLTPGDWHIFGRVVVATTAGVNVDNIAAGLSLTSGTLPSSEIAAGSPPTQGSLIQLAVSFTKGGDQSVPTGHMDVSISAATPLYLVTQCDFGGGTVTAMGFISARRMR